MNDTYLNVSTFSIIATKMIFCCMQVLHVCKLSRFSHVWLFVIHGLSPPGSPVHRILQVRWSGLLCPPPGDLPDPGIEQVLLYPWALFIRAYLTNVSRLFQNPWFFQDRDFPSPTTSSTHELQLPLVLNLQCFSFHSLISSGRNLTLGGATQIPLLPWSLLWSPHLEMISLSFEHHCPLYFSVGTSPIPPYIRIEILPQLPC